MVVPTCNFYHFLVSFASQASPEDIHKERATETEQLGERERERGTMEADAEREKRLRNRRGEEGKEGEETHCHGGTHMTERVSSGEIKVRDRDGKTEAIGGNRD